MNTEFYNISLHILHHFLTNEFESTNHKYLITEQELISGFNVTHLQTKKIISFLINHSFIVSIYDESGNLLGFESKYIYEYRLLVVVNRT